jgi:hypothetical protein
MAAAWRGVSPAQAPHGASGVDRCATAAAGHLPHDSLRIGMQVDRKHHRIVIVAGPYNLRPGHGHMPETVSMGAGGRDAGVACYIVWPFRSWFRGYRSEVLDATGRPLPRDLLHHFTLVNFDRRMLLYPFPERLAGASLNSEDVTVPKRIGAPLSPGMRLGLYLMWHNYMPHEVNGVFFRLTLFYLPSNLQPRPIDALPVVLYANREARSNHVYDAPPGHSERSAIVQFPISGHLVGVGGHLHDYGSLVRLEDVGTGKTVVELRARYDKQGRLLGVARKLFAIRGQGLRIRAKRQYRLVAVYDNPTADSLRDVMGEIMSVFAPDRMREWPSVSVEDSDYVADLSSYGLTGIPDTLTPATRTLPPH